MFCPPGEVELMYSKCSHALMIAALQQLAAFVDCLPEQIGILEIIDIVLLG